MPYKEFIQQSKLEAGGSLFCEGDESSSTVALLATTDARVDSAVDVKRSVLSQTTNDRLGIPIPVIS